MSINSLFPGPFILALLILGCSNAPPSTYSNIRNPNMFATTISYKPYIFQYHNRYEDSVKYERGDGTETNPIWMSNDYFYTGFNFSPYIFDVGVYLTNFYPGAYVGGKYKIASANYFATTSLISGKVLPGWQVSFNIFDVLLSYSDYRENLGSFMRNPGLGEEGVSLVGKSKRYFIGYETKESNGTFACGIYFNQTFFKEVSTIGLEGSHGL